MQFKHPELLYALLLLAIPIIVHLFQLRRFRKVAFTNVQFLKRVILQTRKSSRLKKWLVLCTRLLMLAAIVMAFAQPYLSDAGAIGAPSETVIYLDDSFSMQAKGNRGELLRRAAQDILETVDEDDILTVYTNTRVFRNKSKKALTNDLAQLEYSPTQLDYDAVLLKGRQLFSSDAGTIRNLVLCSDFQLQDKDLSVEADSLIDISLVQLRPVSTDNSGIDSLYISRADAGSMELTVQLTHAASGDADIPVSLFSNDQLIAKTAVNAGSGYKGVLTLPGSGALMGRLSLDDSQLAFDNSLFFNINERPKIKVLAIGEADDRFLSRVYSADEFEFTSSAPDQLNYNLISDQNLIVLNEIETIPLALINSLNDFAANGGYVLTIPSNNLTQSSYNQLLTNFGSVRVDSLRNAEKRITGINFSHPLYSDVFDATVTNFQYPQVNASYDIYTASSPILTFEDGAPFLVQVNRLFLFSAALNTENSNIINSPLIVPTLYNMGRQSLKLPQLYYTLGRENSFDINTTMQQDDILKIANGTDEIIPQQRTFSNKVTVTTRETPVVAGTYAITSKNEALGHISYNYDRNESRLVYADLSAFGDVAVSEAMPELLTTLKSTANVNELWKWFVTFAAILLIIEMLILKYFK